MSSHDVPPEICDHIVDFLQDNPDTLKQCCLVSKSWVSRTRKHLFEVVRFDTPGDIETWKKTFPDPSNSPAHHTHTLFLNCLEVVTAADAAEDGWIQTFSSVACLEIIRRSEDRDSEMDFTPFRKFSPTLRSLDVTSAFIRHSQIIDLIHYLPLLEDLTLCGYDREDDEPQPISSSSTPPPLTGTLWLCLLRGISRTVRRLLDLPNGLHFRELLLHSQGPEDFFSVGTLVEACSDTLECLEVRHQPYGANLSVPLVIR
jgi:hypothetical protein